MFLFCIVRKNLVQKDENNQLRPLYEPDSLSRFPRLERRHRDQQYYHHDNVVDRIDSDERLRYSQSYQQHAGQIFLDETAGYDISLTNNSPITHVVNLTSRRGALSTIPNVVPNPGLCGTH